VRKLGFLAFVKRKGPVGIAETDDIDREDFDHAHGIASRVNDGLALSDRRQWLFSTSHSTSSDDVAVFSPLSTGATKPSRIGSGNANSRTRFASSDMAAA
jgi:hypothetical protein